MMNSLLQKQWYANSEASALKNTEKMLPQRKLTGTYLEIIVAPSLPVEPSFPSKVSQVLKTWFNFTQKHPDFKYDSDVVKQAESFLASVPGFDTRSQECFFLFADSPDLDYFPLDKDCRPLTSEEIKANEQEVKEAITKEMSSWISHKVGKPKRRAEHERETGLKPLTSRLLLEWKRKEGRRVVKARLVLRGFQEQNQQELETRSPTATRTAHRLVAQVAASRRWSLAALDISTAFLQGFTFQDLPAGTKRQPCAFIPPREILEVLAALDPAWKVVLSDPMAWVFELFKSAYGLKDAPLLWFLALHEYLLTLKLKPSSHEQCLYKATTENLQDLMCLVSLHVDDTLICAEEGVIDWFAQKLETKYGKVSLQKRKFTHFGVDTDYDMLKSWNVVLCQRDYLAQLRPIEVIAPRGSGRTQDSKANESEITQFRSLVSAIAWLATTFPSAGACASMYQSRLPTPLISDLHQLNALLAQLIQVYQPLIIRGDIDYRNCIIVYASDASLGNAAKYSQIGYELGLAKPIAKEIVFNWSVISYKSQKSKRVATSTLHSELLGQLAGAEEAVMLQSFLFELCNPAFSTIQLLKADPAQMQPIWGITDCFDLFETLTKSTQPVLTNKSMTLFVEAIREYKREGRIRSFCWCDTRDNVANVLTKLTPAGLLEFTDSLLESMRKASWKPKHTFKVEGVTYSGE